MKNESNAQRNKRWKAPTAWIGIFGPTFVVAVALTLCASSMSVAHAQSTQTQRHTYAEGSPTYYRNTHGEDPKGVSVFRRDPNIWVYTPEFAKRAGMPLEWASDELKGVTAAAFRMERQGAEEDCGWGGNPNVCKPVIQCVLELYFDRQTQVLPWEPKRLVADYDWQTVSSAYHALPAIGWVPEPNGDLARGSKGSPNYPVLGSRQPYSNPLTGEELFFVAVEVRAVMRVLAYDREIHGRYAFVRLLNGCGRSIHLYPNGETIHLQSRDKQLKTEKVFYEILLPAVWVKRVRELGEEKWKRDDQFYKQTSDNMNQGERK